MSGRDVQIEVAENRFAGVVAEIHIAKVDRAFIDQRRLGVLAIRHFVGLQQGIDAVFDVADKLEKVHELHAQEAALRHDHQAQRGHHHQLPDINLA